jgi:hypothetical protein
MSKVVITGNASGTGDFTIAAPNSNTNRTLTLPDEAGTLDTLQRAGNVLQVVQTVKTDVFSATVNYLDSTAVTGLSVNITPISTSSKILVMTSVAASQSDVTVSASGVGFTYIILKRDSTSLGLGDSGGLVQITAGIAGVTGLNGYTARNPNTSSYTFLDSPSTTSEITYSVEIGATRSASNLIYVNRSNDDRGRTSSTITVMEIAG